MTRPVNIYAISRIRDEASFNIVQKHQSQKENRIQYHEIESLRILADNLFNKGVSLIDMDGFFYGYQIPQIGKEFDLLKFAEKSCINIELKSDTVSDEQMLNQLQKNRYYLTHLGKRLLIYTVVTNTMSCYKLSLNDELVPIEFDEIVLAVQKHAKGYLNEIDNLFKVSEYLVSPLNTPEKFIQGEYFLTQAQEQIKKEILNAVDNPFSSAYFHITGKPGTGKTLLLYDIAKALSKHGKTVIIHCGKLSDGQVKIKNEVENLNIVSDVQLKDDFDLSGYSFILVDESHRIYKNQFDDICKCVFDNEQVCIFSSDPEQVLSYAEIRNNIVGCIKELPLDGEFTLSEKIRMNKELHSFIVQMKDLKQKPKASKDYSNVQINYANTTQEAQNLLEYYKKNGYIFINYSKSRLEKSPYSEYKNKEDFDTHHVIGQEFDKVVMLMDDSFYYDENDCLQAVPHPNPDYLYPNLFYQGVTRVREKLALIILKAPTLFSKIISIIDNK